MTRLLRQCSLLLPVLLTACASPIGKESAEMSQQASAEAVEIKVRLLEEPGLAGSAIDVTVDSEKVVLEGFVETREQSQRAEEVAREAGSGGNVVNRITVK